MVVTVPRPATVVVAAVLAFVHVAVLLAGLVDVLFVLGRMSLLRPGSLDTPTLVGVLATAVLVPVVLGTVEVVAAIGALRGRRVARVLLTVVAGLDVVLDLTSIVAALGAAEAPSPSPLMGIGLALSVAVLVLLWLPASRAWFARPSL